MQNLATTLSELDKLTIFIVRHALSLSIEARDEAAHCNGVKESPSFCLSKRRLPGNMAILSMANIPRQRTHSTGQSRRLVIMNTVILPWPHKLVFSLSWSWI